MTEGRSAWALLADMVDRPAPALQEIAGRPGRRWFLPLALTLAALAVYTVVTAPLVAAETARLMAEQLSNLPAEQAATMREQMARFQTPAVMIGTGVVTGILGLAIRWLAQTAILYFGALIASGDLDWKAVLGVVPWLHLPYVVETLLQSLYVVSRNALIVNQGLSYLVSSGRPLEDARNLAYVALSQVTLFRIWHLILVYIFLRAVARMSSSGAWILTLVYLGIFAGVQLGLAALSGLLSAGLS